MTTTRSQDTPATPAATPGLLARRIFAGMSSATLRSSRAEYLSKVFRPGLEDLRADLVGTANLITLEIERRARVV